MLIALVFGVFGWACAWLRIPVIPLALGLVMGDFLEASLRQTLNISNGSWLIFFERPIAACIVGLGFLILIWPLVRMFRPSAQTPSSERPGPGGAQ